MAPDEPTLPSQAPDRTKAKADILESNLFNAVSKQNNPFVLQIHVDREMSPDPVIVQALIQLLPRLRIKIPQALILIRRLLLEEVLPGKELNIQKRIFSLAGQGNPETAHLDITLRAVATTKKLAVEIKGVIPVQPRDGAITKGFFDYERCPGVLLSDGSIDFREINKYPIVRAGDELFFITPEKQGRAGIQYDGTVVPVPDAKPLAITLRGGVDLVDSISMDGQNQGSFIRASKTGVVLLTKTDGTISEVEVRDTLEAKRLDYSTGNIGTNFICPISMRIDTICSQFSIRAKGTIAVGELEGGHVVTESRALINNAHPDSTVHAEKDITVHFSRGAGISSLNGFVTITDEALDSKIDARGIVFDKYKGILAGSSLDAEQITLKNIFLSGDNTIYLGRRLFDEKDKLILARAKLKEEIRARQEQETATLTHLHDTIKDLSRILKTNPLLRDNLRTFILATQSMDYPVLYRELDTMAQTMNVKEVDLIKKDLDTLKRIPEQHTADQEKDAAMVRRIAQAEADMAGMTLTVEALLRRAATLRIFTPDPSKENPEQPDLFVESQQDKDIPVRISGTFNPRQGFILTRA